jgi:hypothetical protein
MRARNNKPYRYDLAGTGATHEINSIATMVNLKDKATTPSLGRQKLIGDVKSSVLYCRNLDKLTTLEFKMVFICQNNHDLLVGSYPAENLKNDANKFLQYEELLNTPGGIDTLYRYTCAILESKNINLLVTAPRGNNKCLSTYRGCVLKCTCYSLTSKTRPEYEQAFKYVKWLLLTGLFLSFANDHVSKVFIKQQEDSVTDVLGAFVHVVAAGGFVFLVDRLIALLILLYDGTPRGGLCFCFCREKTKEKRERYGCFGTGLREARRMRIAFEKFMGMDVQYDPNLTAAHEYDYDSHTDDPVEVVAYLHLKEAKLFD